MLLCNMHNNFNCELYFKNFILVLVYLLNTHYREVIILTISFCVHGNKWLLTSTHTIDAYFLRYM